MMAIWALSTMAGLHILANSAHSLSITNARLLYKTVVFPILIFAVPVWFTGICQKSQIRSLEQAQVAGLKWMIGVFCTTLLAEMHYIDTILPIPQSPNLPPPLKTLNKCGHSSIYTTMDVSSSSQNSANLGSP